MEGGVALAVEEVDALLEAWRRGRCQSATGSSPVMREVKKMASQSLAMAELDGLVGEDELGPVGGGGGDDGPVDLVAGDELHGGLGGLGGGDVGAGDFGGVLAGEQRGVGAGDGHAGGSGLRKAVAMASWSQAGA